MRIEERAVPWFLDLHACVQGCFLALLLFAAFGGEARADYEVYFSEGAANNQVIASACGGGTFNWPANSVQGLAAKAAKGEEYFTLARGCLGAVTTIHSEYHSSGAVGHFTWSTGSGNEDAGNVTSSCPYGGTKTFISPSQALCVDPPACPEGETRGADGICSAGCPVNSSSGDASSYGSLWAHPSCVCNFGYGPIVLNDTCQANTCLAGTSWATPCSGAGCSFPAQDPYCDNGCEIALTNVVSLPQSGGSGSVSGVVKGTSCSTPPSHDFTQDVASTVPDPAPTGGGSPSPCPTGQCQGTFNGSAMCLPCTNVESKTENKTCTNPDGSACNAASPPPGSTVDSTEEKTTCVGGQCTTTRKTTSTTYDGSGNPTGTATTESSTTKGGGTSDMGQFCRDNPSAASCTGVGYDTPADPEVGTQAVGEGGIEVKQTSVGSCPADQNWGHGITFSFAEICEAASMMRPLVLALAWLSAGLIVIGAFRGQ